VISQIAGRLVTKELDHVEIMTDGGVGYAMAIPLSAYEGLPKAGERASLFTHLVVREDGWQLYGFVTAFERRVFQKVLDAKGVGPALALGMLSTLSAERLVRAIREKDVATLQTVPRVGRKKAEQLVLDLADKVEGLVADGAGGGPRPEGASAEDAIRALVSLGYTSVDAEKAVRLALDANGRGLSAPELIRSALTKVGARG
jgi:Holliday junction DNA helicase RuvA